MVTTEDYADDVIVELGLDDFTRTQCIKAVAALDGLDEETVKTWTNSQLSGRLGQPWNEPEDYDGQVAVNGALQDTVEEDFDDDE